MLEDELLRQRFEDARAALKRIRRGESPTAEELAAAPQLEAWSMTRDHGYLALAGYVTGHPTLPDGDYIVTSGLIWISDSWDAARTVSRYYRLARSLEDIVAERQ